ncbi:MAG: hypothetical protein WCA19_07775 [Candidatus Acidiferrales bacterium]
MRLWETSWTLIVVLVLCATGAFAQDQKQETSPIDLNAPLQPLDTTPGVGYSNKPPIGAARGVSAPFDPQPYDPSQVIPDQNTLAGATPFTLGSVQHTRNTFDPAISVSQLGQTVPGASGQTVLTGVSVVGASLNFDRTWSEYHFSAIYNGGETFNLGYSAAPTFFGQTSPHYQFHDLVVSQEADWARWHVLLRDIFMASPGAAFSGQGMGGPGLSAQFSSLLGASLNSFASGFVPSETINTGLAMRYTNAILGQVEYSFSRRSAFTFSSSYGLLHFTVPGYISSSLFNVQAGYDYLLDPFNSVALLASYGKIDYTGTGSSTTGTSMIGTGNSVTDYVGALAYGRKITGRLAFQVAAGPEEIHSAAPGGVGNFHLLFVSVYSTLSYARRRSGVSFSYVRGLNGGSGVLLGATGNTISGSANYQFTRFWTGSVTGGYALNNNLASAGAASTQFDNWFIGTNLGRQVGPHLQINFNYGATRQNNPAICPVVGGCGGTGLQQTFGMSVNWHLRPAG